MARVALRNWIAAMALASVLGVAAAAPAQAQSGLYSEGYQFLEAVKDKDGDKVSEMLNTPGSTVINARELGSGRSAMHIVVERRDVLWINFLEQQGANVDIRDERGITPLMLAVQLGFIEGVERLVHHGARVDITNNQGETPLMYAVHSRNTELMRILLEAGADPDRNDNSGRSAREYAQLRGENDITNEIIARYEVPEDERAGGGATYGPSF